MSEASFHRSGRLARPVRATANRPLPLGFGLLIGVAASLALWFAIGWSFAKLFG